MKEFFEEFLQLLGNCALIICFAFASFLFLSNFYHYKEVTREEAFNLKDNVKYKEYKKLLGDADKKMKSVDITKSTYATTAKPIFEYYAACKKQIDEGTFNSIEDKGFVNTMDVYNSNTEILKKYNNSCIFHIPYQISLISNNASFVKTKTITDQKAEVILSNADYLVKAQLGNSSYSFITDNTRASIYNKTVNEFQLTVENYRLMASLLDDVANWYVSEYGGNV